MSACGKKTSGPLGLGVSTCVRASWHDGECRPWLTSDERDEAELATLRADLARVTAELDAYKRAKEENDDRFMRERENTERACSSCRGTGWTGGHDSPLEACFMCNSPSYRKPRPR